MVRCTPEAVAVKMHVGHMQWLFGVPSTDTCFNGCTNGTDTNTDSSTYSHLKV